MTPFGTGLPANGGCAASRLQSLIANSRDSGLISLVAIIVSLPVIVVVLTLRKEVANADRGQPPFRAPSP